jgi:hypothetical protein
MRELRPVGVRRPTRTAPAVVMMLVGSAVAVAPGPARALEIDVATDATDGYKTWNRLGRTIDESLIRLTAGAPAHGTAVSRQRKPAPSHRHPT